MSVRVWSKYLPAQEIADWRAIFELEDEENSESGVSGQEEEAPEDETFELS
jgi:hypothetical protein